MSVTSLVERLDSLTRAELERLSAKDEDVVYAVAMDDYVTECEHGDATCEPGVSFFLSIPVAADVRAKSAWTLSVRAAMDYEHWRESVVSTWEMLAFERMAYQNGLLNGDLDKAMQALDGEGPTE